MIVVDAQENDATTRILLGEIAWERSGVERLERRLAKARRRLLNREKELARYRVEGVAPRRAGLAKQLLKLKDRAIRSVGFQHRRGRGGEA